MSKKNTLDMSKSFVQTDEGSLDLSKKFKTHEVIIQTLLFACGVLSIFTTLGIIIVLGNESFAFFTRDQWVETNRAILVDMDETTTEFTVEPGIEDAEEGELIRISQEIMRIEEFQNNTVEVEVLGTGGGFERWCSTDEALAEAEHIRPHIVNASRAITDNETATCNTVGIEPIPFRVGTDALAVVVSAENDFVTELTFEELQLAFSTAENWSDVRADFPEEPIQLIIPGEDSGTFDYFVDVVFDDDASQIVPDENDAFVRANEVITSENDNQLVGSISRDANAIGFFGYAYYLENSSDLNIITIDEVVPSAETVEDGTYPLARPLYIYSDADIMRDNPQVAEFIDYYLTHINEVIVEVGYFQASDNALNEARDSWMLAMGVDEMPEVIASEVSGHVESTGSSTVLPLTERIAEIFTEDGFVPRFVVERGIRGEQNVVSHSAGITVQLDDRPTLVEFFTNTSWIPAIGEFGVIPLINATLMTSTIAMLVALPLGIGAAIYLSEYASPRVRSILKPVLEVLAGIPTVVYGYFALTFMTPLLRAIFGADVVNIYNTGSAGIVVGILIIPLVSSMSEDALHAVPQALREASYGLGATKLETVTKVVIPSALSGILAAFIVAVSRAIGETMIVAIAAGAGPNFTFSPFDSAETMTGHIARISGGDLSYDSIDYNSIFAIGLTLFVMTFLLNVLSRVIISRFREAY
jgi:phosphate transport system permease protein